MLCVFDVEDDVDRKKENSNLLTLVSLRANRYCLYSDGGAGVICKFTERRQNSTQHKRSLYVSFVFS